MSPEPHSEICGCIWHTAVSHQFIYSCSELPIMPLHWEAVNASCGHRPGNNEIGPSMFPSKDLENFDHSLGKKERYWNPFLCTKNKSEAQKRVAACHQLGPPGGCGWDSRSCSCTYLLQAAASVPWGLRKQSSPRWVIFIPSANLLHLGLDLKAFSGSLSALLC